MNKQKAEIMVNRLLTNAAEVRHGYASVSVKLHEGRIVEVAFSTTENVREKEPLKNKDE